MPSLLYGLIMSKDKLYRWSTNREHNLNHIQLQILPEELARFP